MLKRATSRPKRILVNAWSARLGGGSTVASMHVRALLEADDDSIHLSVLVRDRSIVPIRHPRLRVYCLGRFPTLLRVLMEHLLVPLLGTAWRADVIYCLGNMGVLHPTRPTVVLMQNMLHLLPNDRAGLVAPTNLTRRIRDVLEKAVARATCRRAKRVICVSATLANAAMRRWPELSSRIIAIPSVLPMGPPASFDRPLRNLTNYCLFVANDYHHKQWDHVIRTFVGNDLPPLLIVGDSPRWKGDARACGVKPSGKVYWVGPVMDRDQLAALYRDAAVVLVHSCSESFGLTLQESLMLNGRVAAADLPAHRELATDEHVTYYDQRDGKAMAAAVQRALRSSPVRWSAPERTTKDLGNELAIVLREAANSGVNRCRREHCGLT